VGCYAADTSHFQIHRVDAIACAALASYVYRGSVWIPCSAAVGLLIGFPVQNLQDEFSHLLMSDTFCRERKLTQLTKVRLLRKFLNLYAAVLPANYFSETYSCFIILLATRRFSRRFHLRPTFRSAVPCEFSNRPQFSSFVAWRYQLVVTARNRVEGFSRHASGPCRST